MTYADAVRAVAADYKRRKTDYEQAESDAFAAHPDFAANEREKRDLLLRQAKGETAPRALPRCSRKTNDCAARSD